MSDLWTAPTAAGPVDWRVRLPGSKSATNRLLVLAALADGRSRLRRPLRSRDTDLMAAGLRQIGVAINEVSGESTERAEDGDWTVDGGDLQARPGARVDAGNAGTVARFLPAVAALARGTVDFDGDPRLRERPMAPLLAALRELGADIDDDGRGGLPFTVTGKGTVRGGAAEVDAAGSSQFVSGLLLAAPRFEHGAVVHATGPVPSSPHLQMTVEAMRLFGAQVEAAGPTWTVTPGPLLPANLTVEPDLSAAAPFLAAAAVTAGAVRIDGWPAQSAQPGARLPDLLAGFGLACAADPGGLTAKGSGQLTGGLDADLADFSELVPVVAVLAALAERPSRLRGLAHMRGQETDRLAALARELGRLGVGVSELDDGLQITPKPLHGDRWATYDDHRLVMAGAVAGLAVPGVQVENAGTAGKTFPGFADLWAGLVAGRPA